MYIKNSHIRRPTLFQLADFRKTKQFGPVFIGKAENVASCDCLGSVFYPLQEQGISHLPKLIRGIVRSRTVYRQADIYVLRQHFSYPADTRPKPHVTGRTVGYMGSGFSQNIEFFIIKVNPVGVKDIIPDKTSVLHQFQRTTPVHLYTK